MVKSGGGGGLSPHSPPAPPALSLKANGRMEERDDMTHHCTHPDSNGRQQCCRQCWQCWLSWASFYDHHPGPLKWLENSILLRLVLDPSNFTRQKQNVLGYRYFVTIFPPWPWSEPFQNHCKLHRLSLEVERNTDALMFFIIFLGSKFGKTF